MSYTFSEARQKLSSVLNQAKRDGEVIITRKDGSIFAVKPISNVDSPLNVQGINLSISASEIVDIIRETREYRNR